MLNFSVSNSLNIWPKSLEMKLYESFNCFNIRDRKKVQVLVPQQNPTDNWNIYKLNQMFSKVYSNYIYIAQYVKILNNACTYFQTTILPRLLYFDLIYWFRTIGRLTLASPHTSKYYTLYIYRNTYTDDDV